MAAVMICICISGGKQRKKRKNKQVKNANLKVHEN